MADINQALSDLQAAEAALKDRVTAHIQTLNDEIAKLSDPAPALQAAADAIEAEVANLGQIDPPAA